MENLALIVDDDTPTRFVYARVLHSLGFETVEAADGDAAVELLKHYRPRVILLDLLLPLRSGFEVLDFIYADSSFERTHVMVISAQSRYEPALRANDHFLLKPVLPQQLRELLQA